MPKALPLHLPTASELHEAHEIYAAREKLELTYRVSRHLLGDENSPFDEAEAVELLLRSWNSRSNKTGALTTDTVRSVLTSTDDQRSALDGMSIASLSDADNGPIQSVFEEFREAMGPIGAGKALGLLNPRFFPIWDTKISEAYCGYTEALARNI